MILDGLKGLLKSRKGTLSLIIIVVSATLAALGKLDTSYAAIMATVQVLYCWVQGKIDGLYRGELK